MWLVPGCSLLFEGVYHYVPTVFKYENDCSVKADVFELLSGMCLQSEEGYKLALDALSHFQVAIATGSYTPCASITE